MIKKEQANSSWLPQHNLESALDLIANQYNDLEIADYVLLLAQDSLQHHGLPPSTSNCIQVVACDRFLTKAVVARIDLAGTTTLSLDRQICPYSLE